MNKLPASNGSTNVYKFRFEQHIIIWISAAVGTVFSCLSLIRYFRHNYQRTQLTYVYHFSLGFSLILSLISTPLHTFVAYFFSISSEQQRRLLCNFDLIVLFIASAGIGYSIAYASLEQTYFIFHSQNIRLTWIRQFTPFLMIFSSCSMAVTLLVLLSNCSSDDYSCLLNSCSSLTFQIIWFVLQFLIPFSLMLIAIFFLIYRIETQTNRIRTSINRKRSRRRFHRILIYLNIYNIYFLFSICPINFYSFLRLYRNLHQPIIEILLINQLFISLHAYSIFIFFFTQVKQPRRITSYPEQKLPPYIIVTRPSIQLDEYERTRL